MPRLFTAIEIPDDIRDEIYRLHHPLPGARWINRDNYHATLRFAGDVDARTARDFADNLSEIEADSFPLRLSGLGVFGGDNPRSIWVGFEPSDALDRLAKAHERAARNAGLPPERRPFKPHVTIVRLHNSRVDAIARFMSRYGTYRSETFYVAHTLLMSSRPSTGGGPYAIEETFAMRDAAAYGVGDDHEQSW